MHRLNLPATGSISLTLDGLSVEADVGFGEAPIDDLSIDGEPARGDGARAAWSTSWTSCGTRPGARSARGSRPAAACRAARAGVVGGGVRRPRARRQPGGGPAARTPGAVGARPAGLRLGRALDLRRLRRVASGRASRRLGLDRRAAARAGRLGPARGRRAGQHGGEEGVVARRHGARRRVAVLPGVGRRRRGRPRRGPRGHPGARPGGARPARRAQRAQDARGRPGGAAAAGLLARRDGGVRAPRVGAPRRGNAGVRHHRRGPAGEGAVRAGRRSAGGAGAGVRAGRGARRHQRARVPAPRCCA